MSALSPASVPSSVSSLVPVSSCVFAHYAPVGARGQIAVVSPSGQVLASSFFALRSHFSFVCALSGSGRWVALRPVRSSSFGPAAPAPAVQSALF